MGGDRKLGNCCRNCYLKPNLIHLIHLVSMMISLSSSQVIKEINRDYHGDIFIIAGDPTSCDPSLCLEGQRFAVPVSGHPCKCQCDPSKQIFREDIQQCVRDLDDCPLVTFTRTYISETIPVVSLPTAGQLVHPGAHLNLENRHNMMNQTCRVESDLVMTNEGWIHIDNKPVFALIVDGSRSFLQWVGNDHNRRQLEQKLVLIRFNCQLKPRQRLLEVAPYRPCAAVRIGWVPGSSLGLLTIQGNGYHDGNTGSGGVQGKGFSGYLIIGLSIGVLGLTYVLSLMIYLRSKRIDNLKHHGSSYQRRQYSSSNQHLNHRRSSSFYGGDSSPNQTGSSSLERSGTDIQSMSTKEPAKPFTLSVDRVDYGELSGEFNPSIVSINSTNSDLIKGRKVNCTDKSSQDGLTHNSFDYQRSSSSLPVPTSSPNSLTIYNQPASVSSSTPLLTLPSASSPFSSISSSSSTSSPSQSLSPKTTNAANHHQHTSSSLNSLQARVKERSAQFNGQICGQSNANVQANTDSSSPQQPIRRPTRLSRRDLAIAPKLLDPEALSSPSPTAIEFLSRLREVISSARGRMRAFRFKPTLLVIPEDDYFISEPESRYRSITSSTTIDSSIDNPSSLESENEFHINRNNLINSSIGQEALSLYYQHDNPFRLQPTQQPLSLPVAITNGSPAQSNWKSSANQFNLTPNLLSFGSSRRATNSPKSKVSIGSKDAAISDSELSYHRSHEKQDRQLSSSSSLSSIYKKNSESSMLITAWGDDKASKVSRREIVDRLAEEMETVNVNDPSSKNSNEDGNMEMTDYANEQHDSLNDLSDINENLFETNRNRNNSNGYEDTLQENLVNLSNEVEKKLAQRSVVPLPEVVANVTGPSNNNKMKLKADGGKSISPSHSSIHNHSKEDSKLSQLVADLKHFTRKRKQLKTAKSLPLVSDNNWMLQPVASMSLRLPSTSRSSLSSSSASKHSLLGNRSMRGDNNVNNKPNTNSSRRYNNKNTKSANKQSKADEKLQMITMQEGRYLNFNGHSISDDERNSSGNEVVTSKSPLESWSLSSEPSNGSSSPNYSQNNNVTHNRMNCNRTEVNINMEVMSGGESILDSVVHGDEMFITFDGNEYDSNMNEGEIGYISRFNLIKKYIDDPNIFNEASKDEGDGHRADDQGVMVDGRLLTTINGNNETLNNQMITNSFSDSSVASSSESSISPSNHHYSPPSNIINSNTTMNQWKSIDSKHFHPSSQSLPLSSGKSSNNLYPIELSDDGLSSASVSSIMFMESPKQGRRKSVDRRLTNQSLSITERDNQLNLGNNNNGINNSMMMVRGGNWNNKANQPNSNGMRLNRQIPVEKRHFPNGLMTIA